ncbi:SWIM zinc finger family protein [Cohnella nanjingensis]|uniref:SWIM zinc finger family protein n=1 Tax=Cohnella nanjingensis TaxID=1387779 RepID=A0A7X0RR42_9BACL|nr:SWIM zinc finger family protein [Cohnella nanjingensis]MBB6672107.1 SWIM zinc finger family protein [Cohnella nanjingensis]
MQPNYVMDDTQWHQLVEDAAEHFNDLTLKRGFQYYKQERVLQLRAAAAGRIAAVVMDEERCQVEIDLTRLADSRCSCQAASGCKHIAAALMAYAERQGRSVNALANAKTAAAAQRAAQAVPAGGVARPQELADRIPGMSAAEWRELFARVTAPLAHETRNVQYVKDALTAIGRLKPALSPVPMRLFALHAQLLVLEEVMKPARASWQQLGSHMGYHTHLAASELQDAIRAALAEGLDLADEPEQWARVEETLAAIRGKMLSESGAQAEYFDIYDRLWRHGIRANLKDRQRYEEELRQLRSAGAKAEAASKRTLLTQALAQSRMRFYLGEDEAAWTLLQEAAGRKLDLLSGDLYRFLADLSEAEDWARLLAWLEAIAPLLANHANRNHLSEYAAYWEIVAARLPGAEARMWDALGRMLPYAGDIYEAQMRARGEWHRWVDYQLSAGREPLDFRATELQPLEKEAPEALLPFYHQAVERYVAEKNRAGYKAAARLLKRLAKLYKKMKLESRWELFLDAFAARHSRLRALQEELRKGKLIP